MFATVEILVAVAADRLDLIRRIALRLGEGAENGPATLLADFWETVDAVLKERGVLS